jgi:glycosyltransferase involved in cell wall biosynthesis
MTRIALLLPNLNGGGAERVLINIGNILVRSGHDVHLILTQNQGVYFNQLENEITLHALNFKKVIYSGPKISKLLKIIQPDVVLSTTHRMNFIASIVCILQKENYRLMLRLPNSPKAEIKFGALNKVRLLLYGFAYKHCNYVLAQSKAMRDEAIEVFKIDRGKVRVLTNPLDTTAIEKTLKRNENPFDNEHINVLAAGRIHKSKGFDFLIESFSIVLKHDQSYLLHIIGDDKGEQASLSDLIKKLGIDQHVIFWGYQNNPYDFYKNCDIYVLSSRWEGLPNTLIECMYLGRPVIVTKCSPVIEELVINNISGYIIDFGDTELLAKRILESSKLNPQKYRNITDNIEDIIFN